MHTNKEIQLAELPLLENTYHSRSTGFARTAGPCIIIVMFSSCTISYVLVMHNYNYVFAMHDYNYVPFIHNYSYVLVMHN